MLYHDWFKNSKSSKYRSNGGEIHFGVGVMYLAYRDDRLLCISAHNSTCVGVCYNFLKSGDSLNFWKSYKSLHVEKLLL